MVKEQIVTWARFYFCVFLGFWLLGIFGVFLFFFDFGIFGDLGMFGNFGVWGIFDYFWCEYITVGPYFSGLVLTQLVANS